MTRNAAYLLGGGVAFAACLFLLSGSLLTAAYADDEPAKTAFELQQEIEEKQAAYAAAREEADAAVAAIEANQARVDELEREIPAQQERSGQAAREMYKFQQQSAGIVDLLLNAGDFFEFVSELEYMNRIADANLAEIERLGQLKDEISATQAQLVDVRREAEARADDAREAMEAAQEAQAEAQRRVEEEARAQAEIAAMAEAMAEVERDNDAGEPVAVSNGGVIDPGGPDPAATEAAAAAEAAEPAKPKGANKDADATTSKSSSANDAAAPEEPVAEEPVQEAPVEVAPEPEPVSEEDAYVAKWAPRIDAYLAGSPLAGQGETFARAAYQYGVDPRFSPAISFTESSKGLYCFKSHNAWGWGSAEWDSWEEAIYDHVAGLARGYGGQISEEGAKKYCPPNWKTWYKRTSEQMELI